MSQASEAKNIYGWNRGPVLPLDAHRAYFQFLTHLSKTAKVGGPWPVDTFAEFGNGTSFAVGFCALLAGARRYLAFDFLPLVDFPRQKSILGQLHRMFSDREPAHNDQGQVAIEFPRGIISDDILSRTLQYDNVEQIAKAAECQSGLIEYVAPYEGRLAPYAGSIDFLLSTATMEHVENVSALYEDFSPDMG